MKSQHFSTTLSVDNTPDEVFAAINNVGGWWSENIDGDTEKLGDEFTYRFQDVHRSTIKVLESVPGKKVVWSVLDNYFKFTEDKTEWNGTKIVFDLTEKDGKTEIHFTHVGLVPEYECFEVCSNAWDSYISGSLRDLIITGQGRPNPKERSGRKATAQ
jgi:Activator of Hsp90 ATPase homolog 1-like protein